MAGVVGVGEKSIEELRKLAQYFPDATEYVSACATHMKNVFDENVSVLGRCYYIRTKAHVEGELIDSCEKINGNNHIITKPVSVKAIHTLSKAILVSDSGSFFAGIEE